jgi:myo-inositol-1(or 4)-monophosphatase
MDRARIHFVPTSNWQDLPYSERNGLLQFAIASAKDAGSILLRQARDGFLIQYKAAVNLVTDADRAAEDAIVNAIRRSFPDHRVLAEERGAVDPGESPYQWVIDPLDGTTNFAHGFPFYAVSIALEYAGQCVLGTVFDPVRNELFTAERGAGAFLNGQRIRVSGVENLDRSLLVTGFAYDIRDNPNNNLDHFARLSLRAQGVRRTGSAALDLCYVATGRFDGFWEVKLKPWDMAAGLVILEEGGGLVTSFQKHTFSIYGQELVATNGLIHDELLFFLNQ